MSTPRLPQFPARLLHWFDTHGRHDLPWQHPRTPYRVWLSEIMLQQTQVSVVKDYFQRFVAALPSLPDLAAAQQDEVLALWSGLGYYSRARNLHAAAKQCVALHHGDLPRDLQQLTALPGIGRSTAGAILAQSWGISAAILDGNVKRVLTRLHGIEGWPGSGAIEKQLWVIAEAALQDVPPARMADYTQAQMDFGATLCTRNKPACVLCPLQADCQARLQGRTAELPTPKPSKTLPQRHAYVLLLQASDGRVLLQRRPPTGVWASLWSLPQFDEAAQAHDWLQQHDTSATPVPLAAIQHTFSHYRLTLNPLQARQCQPASAVRDNGHQQWVTLAELAKLGIPAPIRTLLHRLEEPTA